MNIEYKTKEPLTKSAVLKLYTDANWTAYTKDPDNLMEAIQSSLLVISAWDNSELVGLIRLVGDGKTILYVQDILVLNAYKKNGIGTTLVNRALKQFPKVRQTVLLTDDNPETRGFYESLAFESCDKGTLVAFAKMRP